MITGSDYITAINAREPDRQARAAFQALVLHTAAAGSVLFDFGAGPGIDAKFYVQQGFRVGAYDIDPEMCKTFEQHCRAEMQARQVQLFRGSYHDFLTSSAIADLGSIDLVTANFAPLSLVDEPRELFEKFHALTGPNGKVLISVLNPYFLGDARYGWWWSNLLRLCRNGHYRVQGTHFNVHRRTPAYYAAAAAPYFSLRTIQRGLPTKPGLRRGYVGKVLLLTSLYMFLLFEKRQ